LRDINRTGRAHTDLLSLMVGQSYSDHGPTALEIRNAGTALAHCSIVAIFCDSRKAAVFTIQGLGSCLFTVLPNQQSSVHNNEGLNDL